LDRIYRKNRIGFPEFSSARRLIAVGKETDYGGALLNLIL
jgi:hypothetical protein